MTGGTTADSSGIRAELSIDAADVCPLTDLPEDATGHALSWSSGGGETATEEFEVSRGTDVDASDVAAERVFATASRDVYRFTRERGQCPCERVERHDSPVVASFARNGTLHVVFHVPDVERLRDIVEDVSRAYDSVSVRRLVQAGRTEAHSDVDDLVLVDRGALTDRQREALATAQEMGYFEYPRRANAGEVAAELGVNRSTFVEHLSAAQSKLLSAVLDA
ncbi:MAG: helix-turn-helix domain-containing protein [Haloarculaceae archaeon]